MLITDKRRLIHEQYNPDHLDWHDWSTAISKHFTVGDAVQYDRDCLPRDPITKQNIVLLAKELDKVVDQWPRDITIQLWYCPPNVNRRYGNSPNSQHVAGKAVRLQTNGNIYDLQVWLDKHWYGNLGRYARSGCVYIDNKNGKGFRDGGAKGQRWYC